MTIFVPRVNVHQRLTSGEEDFNNQVDRVAHLMDTTQPLFTVTLSSQNGLMNKLAMVAPRTLGLYLLLSAQPASFWEKHWVPEITYSPRWSVSYQVDYTELFASWKEQCFVLTGMELTLYIDLPSLPEKFLPFYCQWTYRMSNLLLWYSD